MKQRLSPTRPGRLLLLAALSLPLAACAGGDTVEELELSQSEGAAAPTAQDPAALDPAALDPAALDPEREGTAWSELWPEEWRRRLSPEAFKVLREAGTERAFTGELWDEKRAGTYVCAGCELPLFASDTKFKSGTGWPSFWQPLVDENVGRDTDYKIGYERTEVHCARCGGHLGHVFNDGPEPTGLRYCINSVSLGFTPGESTDG